MKINTFKLPRGILNLFSVGMKGIVKIDEEHSYRSDKIIKDVYGLRDEVKDFYLNNFNNTSNIRIDSNSDYIIISDKLIDNFGVL